MWTLLQNTPVTVKQAAEWTPSKARVVRGFAGSPGVFTVELLEAHGPIAAGRHIYMSDAFFTEIGVSVDCYQRINPMFWAGLA